jgi:hypothetical protein
MLVVPELGLSSPSRIRNVEDFPEPLGPTKPVTLPDAAVKDT